VGDLLDKYFGLGLVFALTGFTYGFFLWIDKRVSVAAKEAMATWFSPGAIDQKAMASALLEMFDLIYGKPLLSLRAFLRSAAISIVLTLLFVILRQIHGFYGIGGLDDTADYIIEIWAPFISNILSDYISLFVVRRWLEDNSRSPLAVVATGTLIGSAIILAFFVFRLEIGGLALEFGDFLFDWSSFGLNSLLTGIKNANDGVMDQLGLSSTSFETAGTIWGTFVDELVPAALAVHLWLPLFGLGLFILRGGALFAKPVAFMRWFLEQGDNHPYEAVGYVAAGTVFLTGAIVHWLI
jgi:hypothetical protein